MMTRPQLDCYSVPHDMKIYPATKHAFFNDTLKGIYHEAAARDSWERVLAFFGERIEGKAEVE
jgi:carboxymethylenebutenolidase